MAVPALPAQDQAPPITLAGRWRPEKVNLTAPQMAAADGLKNLLQPLLAESGTTLDIDDSIGGRVINFTTTGQRLPDEVLNEILTRHGGLPWFIRMTKNADGTTALNIRAPGTAPLAGKWRPAKVRLKAADKKMLAKDVLPMLQPNLAAKNASFADLPAELKEKPITFEDIEAFPDQFISEFLAALPPEKPWILRPVPGAGESIRYTVEVDKTVMANHWKAGAVTPSATTVKLPLLLKELQGALNPNIAFAEPLPDNLRDRDIVLRSKAARPPDEIMAEVLAQGRKERILVSFNTNSSGVLLISLTLDTRRALPPLYGKWLPELIMLSAPAQQNNPVPMPATEAFDLLSRHLANDGYEARLKFDDALLTQAIKPGESKLIQFSKGGMRPPDEVLAEALTRCEGGLLSMAWHPQKDAADAVIHVFRAPLAGLWKNESHVSFEKLEQPVEAVLEALTKQFANSSNKFILSPSLLHRTITLSATGKRPPDDVLAEVLVKHSGARWSLARNFAPGGAVDAWIFPGSESFDKVYPTRPGEAIDTAETALNISWLVDGAPFDFKEHSVPPAPEDEKAIKEAEKKLTDALQEERKIKNQIEARRRNDPDLPKLQHRLQCAREAIEEVRALQDSLSKAKKIPSWKLHAPFAVHTAAAEFIKQATPEEKKETLAVIKVPLIFKLRHSLVADYTSPTTRITTPTPIDGIAKRLKGLLGNDDVESDARQNIIIVYAEEKMRCGIQKLIDEMDTPRGMVQISVSIVDLDVTGEEDWEHGFLVNGRLRSDGRHVPFNSGFNAPGLAVADQATPATDPIPPAFSPHGLLGSDPGLNLVSVLNTSDLTLTSRLRALTGSGRAYIRSQPAIVTLDNEPARITDITSYYPVLEGEWQSNPYRIRSGLELVVLPRIMDESENKETVPANGSGKETSGKESASGKNCPSSDRRRIALLIDILDAGRALTGKKAAEAGLKISDVKATNRVATQVHLASGEALVLGGNVRTFDGADERRVPVLGSIPVVGRAFKTKVVTQTRVRRFYIVAPRILDDCDNAPSNYIQESPAELGSQYPPIDLPEAVWELRRKADQMTVPRAQKVEINNKKLEKTLKKFDEKKHDP